MKTEYTADQIAEFAEKKAAADERRAAKQQAALDRAEAIERGEEVESILRNGRQGKGEWVNGVYFMDDFDPETYLRQINEMKTPVPVDPEVAFINLLAERFPHLKHLEKVEFLTAACSILFDDDEEKLLSRTCQMLETITGHTAPCGTLVTRYRRLPLTKTGGDV
jgi:hypothetical protein